MRDDLTRAEKLKLLDDAEFDQEATPAGVGEGTGQNVSDNTIIPENGGEVKKKEQSPTQAEILLELVQASGAEFFKDNQDEPYAAIRQSGHREIFPLSGRKFKYWLSGIYYKSTGKSVNNDTIQQVVSVLAAKAIFDGGEPVSLHTRIARDADGAFWYDLSDEEWRAVKITVQGWEVTEPPIMFKRFGHQQAQTIPRHDGDVRKLLRFIPLEGDFAFLLLVWVISSFIPEIPHPVPILYGEKGAAKTTACEFLKSLIDTSSLKTLHLSNDQRTLAVNLDQHHFLPFDNISYISDETSDALCRAVTGGGIQQRKLFTNSDDTVFTFQRVLSINGINNAATRPDLLDRSLLFKLERITEENRKELSALQAEFEAEKPEILGGAFDTLAKAMTIYSAVKLEKLGRMADFTRWGYAVGEALEQGGGEKFLAQYKANRDIQNQEAIENDPVATLVVAFMDDRGAWSGTSTQLYSELVNIALDHRISTQGKSFPPDPTRLSKRLNSIRSNLEGANIKLGLTRDKKGRTSLYCI